MTTATSTTTIRHAQGHDGKHTAVWTAKIALAAVFLFAAVPKLAGVHTSVHMFAQMGAGQWLCYLIGTAELAGAVGLLIPRLAALAAAGLAADMVGASIVNVVVLHNGAVALTIVLSIVCVLVARNHWAQTKGSAAALDD
jgi:putative oxidoreductase